VSKKNKNTPTNMPNQYAKVKNAMKGEEELQDATNPVYGFVDEFLDEALNTSNIYEAQQGTYLELSVKEQIIHTSNFA
jgi:hypothetical protein